MNSNFHTFVIAAYGESPYLEDCIRSLKGQTRPSPILCVTSTPGPKLQALLDRYGIPLIVREGESGIGADWNFALAAADSLFVTIAHQDDCYGKHYTEELHRAYEAWPDMTLFCTDAVLLRHGKRQYMSPMEAVKLLLRLPLRWKGYADRTGIKRLVLRFGNPIMCPSCAYRRNVLPRPFFREDLRFALDWDCLIRLADREGRWICAEKPLLCYRVHDGAATARCLQDHSREREEADMFAKFWPGLLVRLLMKGYRQAYGNYR